MEIAKYSIQIRLQTIPFWGFHAFPGDTKFRLNIYKQKCLGW